MKPSFALDFRDGAVALLHRTSRGWQQVGATSFDAPDLTEALAYLRSTALGLSPRGLATKLVIPNDQILYTTVHAPGPDLAKRRKQIRAALEGATPYKVEDLVFDWWGNGPEVQVAVVAKETLAEAEGFATEHRLNPVSFAAAPDNGLYLGEPFFGTSALSATLLAEGEKVERDNDPIAVIARDLHRSEAAAPVAAAVAPAPEPTPEPRSEPEPATDLPQGLSDDAGPKADDMTQVAVPAGPEPVAEVTPEPVLPQPENTPVTLEPEDEPAAQTETAPAPHETPKAHETETEVGLPDFTSAKAPPEGAAPFDMKSMAVDLVDEAPMALDVGDHVKSGETADDAPQALAKDDLPPEPASSILAAFTSRRSPEPAAPPPAREATTTDFAKAAADARARKAPAVGPAPTQRPSVPRPPLAKPASSATQAARDALPFPGRGAGPGKAKASAPTPRPERNVVPMAKAQPAAASPVGARKATGLDGRPLPVPGKPRYLGLVLTGLLLLALAIVAAWSSFSLSRNDVDPATQPSENAVASSTQSEPMPTMEDEALADGEDLPPAEEGATEASNDPLTATPDETVIAAGPEETTPAEEPAPETGLTGESLATATPGNDPQDEIFLAANDLAPQTRDPVVLASPATTTDPPPQLGAPPPPFGTVYAFDADGRIKPTPEGIITPEGVLLVEGKPKLVPPLRPAGATLAAAAPAATTEPAPTPADPALAGKKPRSRPAGLTPAPAAEEEQGQAVSPAPGLRFAEVRPQQRPTALTAPSASGADAAAAASSLAATGLQQGNGIGLVNSRKPLARPDGMEQAVDAAVAAALDSGETASQTADLAPEEQEEPEVDSPAPNIPTNASVAKQATDKNALNLSRLALIGIFGNSAGRYAMIRQPGGGIKKVKVGDSIDGGGKVAAITATELQYQKGGRMVVLTLPKG